MSEMSDTNMDRDVRNAVASTWWVFLLFGLLYGVIGLLLLVNPSQTLETLVQLTGILWLVIGVLRIFAGLTVDESRGANLIGGIIGVVVGLIVLARPTMTTVVTITVAVVLIGLTAILYGLVDIFRGRAQSDGGYQRSWGSFLIGLVEIVLGVVIIANLFTTAQILVLITSILLIIVGLVAIVFSFQVRSLKAA